MSEDCPPTYTANSGEISLFSRSVTSLTSPVSRTKLETSSLSYSRSVIMCFIKFNKAFFMLSHIGRVW